MFSWLGKRLTERELLEEALEDVPDQCVGWPDDRVELKVRSPGALQKGFREALRRFRELWPGAIIVDVSASMHRKKLHLRVCRVPSASASSDDHVTISASEENARRVVEGAIAPLSRVCATRGGEAFCGGSGTYFDFTLPISTLPSRPRYDFPELPASSWNDFYRAKVNRTSWSSLRHEAYRFSHLASKITKWGSMSGASEVLIPAVGICADPWLFTNGSMSVVAIDGATAALDVVASPGRLPKVYGVKAKERWEITEAASWGGHHPYSFSPMPDLAKLEAVAVLRERVRFVESDWAEIPLGDDSVDLVYATNALPRDDPELRTRVLREWARVLRPGGLMFLAMHSDKHYRTTTAFFDDDAWCQVDALRGQPVPHDILGYQLYLSSG